MAIGQSHSTTEGSIDVIGGDSKSDSYTYADGAPIETYSPAVSGLLHALLAVTALARTAPATTTSRGIGRVTGGLISAKTLSNEDALQKGPRERVRAGSKVGYTRAAAMAYLRKKLKPL